MNREILGRLLFCLPIHCHCEQLDPPLCVMYVDDVLVGGQVEDVLHNLEIIKAAECHGLTLKPVKCEVVCKNHCVRGHIIVVYLVCWLWTLTRLISWVLL